MRSKTPQEKKNLDYKKERRTGSLHGYVKSYPKTKARVNKASRHEANAVLKDARIESLQSAVEVTDNDAITRERLQYSIERDPGADLKAYSYTLKEWVGGRLEGRIQFAGDRYFAEVYKSERHRKAFSKYLQTILSGRSAKSFEIARFYKEVLNPSTLEAEEHHARRRAWLVAFFRDEPEYESKLRDWMQEMEHLYFTS
jgi:hypothetical protein